MNRYFTDDSKKEQPVEVFTITKTQTNQAIRENKRQEKKDNKDKLYAKKRKKGIDKYPGKAPIDSSTLEKHQYSDALNPKRFKTFQVQGQIFKSVRKQELRSALNHSRIRLGLITPLILWLRRLRLILTIEYSIFCQFGIN